MTPIVHEAGPPDHLGEQVCQRCGRRLAGPPTMVPPGMTIQEVERLLPETFRPGAFVLEEATEDGAGRTTTEFREMDGADVATSWWPMCDQSVSQIQAERDRDD